MNPLKVQVLYTRCFCLIHKTTWFFSSFDDNFLSADAELIYMHLARFIEYCMAQFVSEHNLNTQLNATDIVWKLGKLQNFRNFAY